jgi:hypothetical protein
LKAIVFFEECPQKYKMYLRYIRKNGGIEERFLHFTNISGDQSAVSQSEHAKQVQIDQLWVQGSGPDMTA